MIFSVRNCDEARAILDCGWWRKHVKSRRESTFNDQTNVGKINFTWQCFLLLDEFVGGSGSNVAMGKISK